MIWSCDSAHERNVTHNHFYRFTTAECIFKLYPSPLKQGVNGGLNCSCIYQDHWVSVTLTGNYRVALQ